MTRSIFDPNSSETEESGSTLTPPQATSTVVSELTHPRSAAAEVPPSAELEQLAAAEEEEARGKRQRGAATLEVELRDNGKFLFVRLTGKLHKDDYARFVPIVDQAVLRHGKIRMLVEMHDFHGWDAAALWEDVKFDVTHFHAIERVAIIGDKKWEQWMAAFCKPFTAATIEYFEVAKSADAHAWISAP